VAGVSPEVVRDAIFAQGDAQVAAWQFETGQITNGEYFDFFCRAIGTQADRKRLAEAVCDIFAPIDETWALVRRLAAARYTTAVFSNTNHLQWEHITDGRFPLLARIGEPGSAFAWAILSYEARSMKPDRAIYEAAIERAGVAPQEIFFTDDRPENVAGARAAGIDAVQFVNCDTLIADLRERGVTGI
jgi:putative hydrolase of the HAD superfamily